MAKIPSCVLAAAYCWLLAVVRPVDLATQDADGLTEPRGRLDEQLRAKRATQNAGVTSGPVSSGGGVSGGGVSVGGVSGDVTSGPESGEIDEEDYFYNEDGYRANYDYYQYDNNETDWNGTMYDYRNEYYQYDNNETEWNSTEYEVQEENYDEENTGDGQVL